MKKTLLFIILGLMSASAQAQTLTIATPKEVGLSEERLKDLDAFLQQRQFDRKLPGCVAMVIRKNQIGYMKAMGMMNSDLNKPMNLNTIFRIKSMSKPITAVAVLLLMEEGKLSLEDPVSKFLPEFANPQVADFQKNTENTAATPITIRHLLMHTSGLGYGWMPIPGEAGKRWKTVDSDKVYANLETEIKAIATLPLLHQPGATWTYGRSTDVLGRVVEVASGMSFGDFLQKRIFEPLGMKDTGFDLPADKLSRLAAVYGPDKVGFLQVLKSHKQMSQQPVPPSSLYLGGKQAIQSGGGGLLSTARDYAHFAGMLLNKGRWNGKQLLKPESVALLSTDHYQKPMTNPSLVGYGFGLSVAVKTGPSTPESPSPAGEYFWAGAFNTFFWIDPKNELIGILMTQIDPYGYENLGRDFKKLVYKAI